MRRRRHGYRRRAGGDRAPSAHADRPSASISALALSWPEIADSRANSGVQQRCKFCALDHHRAPAVILVGFLGSERVARFQGVRAALAAASQLAVGMPAIARVPAVAARRGGR
jgi:hypothetical protein